MFVITTFLSLLTPTKHLKTFNKSFYSIHHMTARLILSQTNSNPIKPKSHESPFHSRNIEIIADCYTSKT